jgi:hypothetical protein
MSPTQVLKKSFDTHGIENTLKIDKPAQLYGALFEEITAKDIGKVAMEKLEEISGKTLDMQRPFLMMGDTAMFYAAFFVELEAKIER